MSWEMTEIEQKHEGIGDNVGNNKQTNNHHAPTGVSNIQAEKIEMMVTQYINQELPKKKRPFNLTIEEDDISPEEVQEYLQIILDAVKKRKGSDKCSITLQFTAEGSTQFILDGDIEDLQILADLQAEGKLEELLNQLKSDDMPEIKVKQAEFVEDEEIIKKAESIKDIQEGKANKKKLNRANLIGANLIGANLTKANLSGANLTKADLYGANLSGANLRGADLSRANLSRANLSEANLREANLEITKLIGADLSGADLSEAKLIGADLSEANLIGADLSGANLSWPYLIRAKINKETLVDNKWRLVHDIVNKDRENRDLHSQDLSFAWLQDSFLYRANLRGVNLTESNLRYANLKEADLSGSNLTNANLENANLIDAVFDHAIVEGAEFGNNKGITEGLKRDLKAKGAIFADDFGAGDRVLTRV